MFVEQARAPAFAFFKNCILLLCLLAPSLWMIANVPPLWRDADAYYQLTKDPLIATSWGHAPAYSYAARVPLFLGEQLTKFRGLPVPDHEAGARALTDMGVWLLVITQHLAMCASGFCFIRRVAAFFFVRLCLAMLWASNALFYTFAHCVGSETLGLICIILVATTGLRLIRNRGQTWTLWYIFALALCSSILSRHVNLWLILLLPAAFLLSSLTNRTRTGFASNQRRKSWLRKIGSKELQSAIVAIALGLVCLASGLIASLLLIIISPSIMKVDPSGVAAGARHLIQHAPIFPLENPGILSIPLGFLGAILGTFLTREPQAEVRFAELSVRANTGLGAERAD